MMVFIWKSVNQCTNNYHSGGGVVVFADDIIRARELANNIPGCNISEYEEPNDVRYVVGISGHDGEIVYIMPDAGCC